MQFHPAVKTLLEEIAENSDKLTLTHSEVIGIGIVFDYSFYVSDTLRKELGFYINSMTIHGLTHKQRSFFAKRALHVMEVYETKKYQEPPLTPDNF